MGLFRRMLGALDRGERSAHLPPESSHPPATRAKRALHWLDPAAGPGLEIGALHKPLLTPALGPVEYADHLPTEGLREKYRDDPNVDVNAIVEVSHVLDGRPLAEVTGSGRFHHVVASHVVEHAPDLIGWLEEIRSVLRPGGVLSLVIPDKRYTFDVMRRISTVDAMIDARLRGIRQPTPQQAFDHFGNVVHADTALLWRDGATAEGFRRMHTDEFALFAAEQALQVYVDSHCWVFTPASFFDSLRRLAALGLFRFEVIGFENTRFGELEFFVFLRAPVPHDFDNEAQLRERLLASIPRQA